MPNLSIKLYDRYVCIGKNIVYIGFGTLCGFSHPLGVLEHTPTDKGGYYTENCTGLFKS